jgi:hypothetical protein
MLLRPFMDPANGINACTWLALEQALAIEGSALVLELMRPLRARGHGAELLAWLEANPLPLPPAELAIFHASLAIESKQFERAADMLEDVCAASPQDVPGVLAMIDSHRAADFAFERLYLKYAPKEEKTAVAASSDEDFQTFEPGEFKLETSAPAPTAPMAPPARSSASNEKQKPRFNSSPFSTPGAKADTPERAEARKSFIDRGELSLDDDGSDSRAEEPSTMFVAPSIDITEEHVTNVGQKLYEAGASAFFHIDEEATAAAAGEQQTEPGHNGTEAASVNETAAIVEPDAKSEVTATIVSPGAATPVTATPPDEPFEARFARFSRGELPNAAVLALLEEAVEDGRAEELHELLYFEPETGEEHIARYYYQAEYHLMCNRPIQALAILARLDAPGLDPAHQQRVWYKIAVAQRMTHNYEGAGKTLERLVQQFPGREDFARLKRRNQEQFIEGQSLAATTLEKTSSLD